MVGIKERVNEVSNFILVLQVAGTCGANGNHIKGGVTSDVKRKRPSRGNIEVRRLAVVTPSVKDRGRYVLSWDPVSSFISSIFYTLLLSSNNPLFIKIKRNPEKKKGLSEKL